MWTHSSPAIIQFPGTADSPKREPVGTGSVTLEEVGKLYLTADAATWPKLKRIDRDRRPDLKPADWWRAWLCLWWHYGAQTQDVAAFQNSRYAGLLWASVFDQVECPDSQFSGLRSEFGWLQWTPGRSTRPVILPQTDIVARHLAVFRGLDSERVFPNGRNKIRFTEAFNAIRDAAGLGPDVTIADCGERQGVARRSIRNGSRDAWDRLKPGLGSAVQGTATFYSERRYRETMRDVCRLAGSLPVPGGFHDIECRTAVPVETVAPSWPKLAAPGSGDMLRAVLQSGVMNAKLRTMRPNTRRNYDIQVRHLGDFLGRPATVDDLNDEVIGDCMWWLYNDGEREARTVNKFRDVMLAVWRQLHRKGQIDRYPDVPPMREPERTPVAWSRDDLRKLWEACQAEDGWIGDVPARHWWHALHAMLWDTGERVAAITRLEWIDVDLEAGYVRCRAENRKGGRKDRGYSLHPDTVECLRVIHQPEGRHVLPWPFCETYLWTKYGNLLERAGLPSDRQHKFHAIRKSVASYFEAAGGNATELLGHSSRRVTRAYLDPKITRPQQAVDLLFRPDVDGAGGP